VPRVLPGRIVQDDEPAVAEHVLRVAGRVHLGVEGEGVGGDAGGRGDLLEVHLGAEPVAPEAGQRLEELGGDRSGHPLRLGPAGAGPRLPRR